VTPAEANLERREAAIRRGHRIDALDHGQLANFLHRLAAIVPGDVDRVLGEFDANAPKPRTTPMLHPVRLYTVDVPVMGIMAYCDVCRDWHSYFEDGHSLDDFNDRAREHSGIVP
jgi:hypothetical protein